MQIMKAEITDSEALTTITKKSKAYWGFPEETLKEWENLLTVTKDYINRNEVYKLLLNDKIIGYYSYLIIDNKTVKLDNIFIHPEFIGKGYGTILMNDFLLRIKELSTVRVVLEAEPKAEKFYEKFGFVKVGQLESSIKNRYLPVMELITVNI